jgi:hypothetical protein
MGTPAFGDSKPLFLDPFFRPKQTWRKTASNNLQFSGEQSLQKARCDQNHVFFWRLCWSRFSTAQKLSGYKKASGFNE